MNINKPKKRINIIEASMKYKQITFSIVIIAAIAGLWSLFTMPRMENPELTIKDALVIVAYPGADENKVEEQVTKKLEQYLFSFEEIKKDKTYSTTKDGQVIVNVRLEDWVSDTKNFWSRLQHGLNIFKVQTLPYGTIGPILNSEFGSSVAVMIAVSSQNRNYNDLDKYVDKLEDAIKLLKKASKIKRVGGQKDQIYVTIDNQKMGQYNLSVDQIIKILQAQNATIPAGDISLDGNKLAINTSNSYKNVYDIENQIIYTDPDNKIVRLKDIATIERRFEEPKSYVKMGNNKVMILSVEMQPGENIVVFGDELKDKINQVKAKIPPDVKIETIVSQPDVTSARLKEFMTEFGIAIISVIIVVMIFLPLRMAVVSSIACPISILITFTVINVLGFEINQVTLAAFIICLGMVVDDAVVIVDNYIEKLDEGFSPWEAAWKSATQLLIPVFTATLTIIFAFLPLELSLHGVPRDFIAFLPPTVAIALASSFFVAIFVTPYICYIFIKKGLKNEKKVDSKPKLLDKIQEKYDNAVLLAFKYRKIVLSLGIVSIVVAVIVALNVKREFLPILERDQFNIEVWLPEGSKLEKTEDAVKKIEALLAKDNRVKQVASFVGTSSPRFYVTYAPEIPRENYAQIFVTTKSTKATDDMVKEYLPVFENFLKDGHIRLHQVSLSLAVPLEIKVIGENLTDIKNVGKQVKQILEKTEGANTVRDNYGEDYLGMRLNINEDMANRLGLSSATISQTLAASLKGYPVSNIWEGDKPVEILLRLNADSRKNIADIQNIYLNSMINTKVPLKQVATLEPYWHTGNIVRLNGLRTLTVSAECQKGEKAAQVFAKAKLEIEKLQLPNGVRIEYGGDDDSTKDNLPGLLTALGISSLLIFVTLLLQFRSFKKAMVVLMTFPLSLLGAMLGLWLTGNQLGFTAFLGIVSLIGIVVRNGIILVDYADELVRDHGMSIRDAAIASAQRRMRPIFLTSSAAAIGALPMIIKGSPLWAPMGSVLAIGLMFSMVMTLFIVPILYYKLVKMSKPTTDDDTAMETV